MHEDGLKNFRNKNVYGPSQIAFHAHPAKDYCQIFEPAAPFIFFMFNSNWNVHEIVHENFEVPEVRERHIPKRERGVPRLHVTYFAFARSREGKSKASFVLNNLQKGLSEPIGKNHKLKYE